MLKLNNNNTTCFTPFLYMQFEIQTMDSGVSI